MKNIQKYLINPNFLLLFNKTIALQENKSIILTKI